MKVPIVVRVWMKILHQKNWRHHDSNLCPFNLHWKKRNFSAFVHPPRLYLPTKLVRIIPYLLSHPQAADISKNDQHFSPSDVIVEAVRPEIQPADNLPLPVKFSSLGKLADFDQRPKNVVIVSASNVQAPVWIYYQVKVLFREMIGCYRVYQGPKKSRKWF